MSTNNTINGSCYPWEDYVETRVSFFSVSVDLVLMTLSFRWTAMSAWPSWSSASSPFSLISSSLESSSQMFSYGIRWSFPRFTFKYYIFSEAIVSWSPSVRATPSSFSSCSSLTNQASILAGRPAPRSRKLAFCEKIILRVQASQDLGG